MTTPYLTEDGETLLTEDGADTLILEQDDAASTGGTRARHIAALLRRIRQTAKKVRRG